jgi:hypothetical protein
MTRVLSRIDLHLLVLAVCGAIANAIAVTGRGVDWYERPAWLAAIGFALAVEWLIAFSWWENYRHRPGGWTFVFVNQILVLALFVGGIVAGMGWQQFRSGIL